MPSAPTLKWWDITLCHNSTLLLPKPPGQMSVAELNNTQVLLNAEAHRNTTFDLNSYVLFSWASITSTPVALFLSLSYSTFVTIEKGRRVRFPVATAAGKVDD